MVPNREIVLCAGTSISKENLIFLLEKYTENHLVPRLTVASKWPAHTREQYDSFSKQWPIKAKPEKKRLSLGVQIYFRSMNPHTVPDQVDEMYKFLIEAILLSQIVYDFQKGTICDLPIATLIVDPSTSRILASTFDTRLTTGKPLSHPVMTAINLLALSPQSSKHFASGYDVYTTHEPCTMCCMAMTHSRVRRCIFWRDMKYTGGKHLGWLLKQKYMCFQWIGEDDLGHLVKEGIPWDICA
jgi:tRNA(Arg) A34 adenosine deaminase TadA